MFSLYQKYLSPLLHYLTKNLFGQKYGCRYVPTCSEYAKQSFKKYSFPLALIKSVWRVIRCNPLSKGGLDYP